MELFSIFALFFGILGFGLALFALWKPKHDEDELYSFLEEIEGLKTKNNIDHAELWEYIEGVVEPLNRRIATRIKRAEKTEDLNIKKSGMIR